MKKILVHKLNANYPLLSLTTPEEMRAELTLVEAARETKRKLFVWSVTKGFTEIDVHSGKQESMSQSETAPDTAIRRVGSLKQSSVVAFLDFNPYLRDPLVVRTIRDMIEICKSKLITMIFLGAALELPPDIARECSEVQVPLPDETEIKRLIEATIEENSGIKKLDPTTFNKAVEAGKGLTTTELENALLLSVVSAKAIDPKIISEEKAKAVRLAGALEILEPPKGGLDDVGGLDTIKEWVRTRGAAFSPAAKSYGLPNPKGLLAVGVPGCGKSLIATAAASALDTLLVRLDVARLFAGIVGETETNTRRALDTIDAIAPCVVMIDELEKAFAGSDPGRSQDSGVSARVMGTFLTWMQEHKSPVFLIATANDITSLPAPLLRKGRWDAMMWVDLPSEDERQTILAIHLRKRGRDPKKFDLGALASISDGHSGAELEQAIVDAMFHAFADGGREFVTKDIGNAIGTSVPLSKTMADQIQTAREWAKTHCQMASVKPAPTAAKQGRKAAV